MASHQIFGRPDGGYDDTKKWKLLTGQSCGKVSSLARVGHDRPPTIIPEDQVAQAYTLFPNFEIYSMIQGLITARTISAFSVLEYIPRDVIEEFGSQYDTNPSFSRHHISGFVGTSTDPWVEPDELPHTSHESNF